MTVSAEPAAGSAASSFGSILREWRRARGASQLELSLLCGLSQKHLSFLESGRSRPSRGMVLQLASALGMPLRQQNAMLLAAGFAPMYKERSLQSQEMRPIERAFSLVLAQQEPFPAIVVDRAYNVLRANDGMSALLAFLTGGVGMPGDQPLNGVELTLRPDGLRPWIENWEEVATWLLRRLRAEALIEGTGRQSHLEMLNRLRTLPGVRELEHSTQHDQDLPPTLILRFVKEQTRLSLFSVIASLGTPLDVSLQGVHVELFFAADEATEAWFKSGAQIVRASGNNI